MYRNLRKERAAAGLCIECGGKLDTDGKMCCSCRQKAKSFYRLYQSIGICPKCKKAKLYGTEKSCPECRAKGASYMEVRRENMTESKKEAQRKRDNAYNKARYDKRKEAGICVYCGKRKSESPHISCGICTAKRKMLYRKYTGNYIPRSERPSYGLCYFCGKPLDRDGKACKACSNIAAVNLSKSWGKNNTYWKADNTIAFNKTSKCAAREVI